MSNQDKDKNSGRSILTLAPSGEVMSLLPQLKELSATAIVVNLAYLNLDRFRYRKQIREHAREELATLNPDGKALPSGITQSQWYKQIERLSEPDSDKESWLRPGGKRKRERLPTGLWSKMYKMVFEAHQDRIWVMGQAGLAFILLCVGSAHSVNRLAEFSFLFDRDNIYISLYLLIVVIVVPVLFVLTSRFVVKWAQDLISNYTAEFAKLLQGDAQRASLGPGERDS